MVAGEIPGTQLLMTATGETPSTWFSIFLGETAYFFFKWNYLRSIHIKTSETPHPKHIILKLLSRSGFWIWQIANPSMRQLKLDIF